MSQNKTVTRIGVYDEYAWPPYEYACSNITFVRSSGCPTPGFIPDIADYIFQRMRLPYVLVNCGRSSGSIYINGTNGGIDLLAGPYIKTAARSKYFDYTVPIQLSSYSVTTPTRLQTSFWTTLTRLMTPFSTDLWTLFFICLFAVTFIRIMVVLWNRYDHDETKQNYANRFSMRHLATSWAITSMLCLALYRSFLLSSMMLNTSTSTPIYDYDSLVEMIGNGQAKLYMNKKDHVVIDQINTEEKLSDLRNVLVDNPIVMANNQPDMIIKAEEHMSVTIKNTLITEYNVRYICNVHTFQIDIGTAGARVWLFRKNFSLTDQINSAIINSTSALTHIINSYSESDRNDQCDTSSQRSTPVYVTFETLVSAVIFLVIGSSGGFVAVVLERFTVSIL